MDEFETSGNADVQMYTLPGCMSCFMVRRLLRRRGVAFEEFRGEGVADFRAKLRRLTGAATVPQVLIHGEPVGGADSLFALDRTGVLLPKVRGDSFPVAITRRRRSLFKRGYEVRLVDADGRLLAEAEAVSEGEAESIAAGLAGEFRTGAS